MGSGNSVALYVLDGGGMLDRKARDAALRDALEGPLIS